VNIQKLYKYANSIAGELGPDLFHHVYLELAGKEIEFPETYFYTVMSREFKNADSKFNKQHRIRESGSFPALPDEETEFPNYDIFLLYNIFQQLDNEGYGMEVQVYKECKFNTSAIHLAQATGVNKRTILKICNFVKHQIKTRYESIESNNL